MADVDVNEHGTRREHVEDRVETLRHDFQLVRNEIAKVIVGHEEVVEGLLTCLLCDGHALLEGVPGLGKTLLVKSLGAALHLQFSRIQFTPDLMPADIIGTRVVLQDERERRYFEFQAGPVFSNIVLADEINRATPKTQSALLEAMQEQSVTVAGTVHRLERPFLVLATQNPLEMDGTYPLPEAQLDRFLLKLNVTYPSFAELSDIVDRTTQREAPIPQPVLNVASILEAQQLVREVPLASHVRDYAVNLGLSTHADGPHASAAIQRYVRYGTSPRGVQSLVLAAKVRAFLAGRPNVDLDDIRAMVVPCLRHRLILNFEGEAEGIETADLLQELLQMMPARATGAARQPV
jgi:MoxR-like ATPase